MDEKNTRRCVFIDDATWELTKKAAKRRGITQASWIRESIKRCLGTAFAPIYIGNVRGQRVIK